MKKTILFSLFVVFSAWGIAQNNSAAFLSFNGEGNYYRSTKKTNLKFPMLFNSGDKIKLTEGNATLLIADGSEINLKAGTQYKVPHFKKEEMLVELDASIFQDYVGQSQSNSLVSVRGDSVYFKLYPISSKLIKPENCRIFWKVNTKQINYKFVLDNARTLEEVFKKDDFSDLKIELKSVNLLPGVEYTWTLNAKEFKLEQFGFISVLTKEERLALPAFRFSNKMDYIKAFKYYEENEFYFDAYKLIEKASKKYPKTDLFKYILQKMNGE